jgi:adenosylhomocysteine nucleosidase
VQRLTAKPDIRRIVFLAALNREIRPLLCSFDYTKRWRENDLRLHHVRKEGLDMLLVETGMGRRRAEMGARLVLDRFKPDMAVCCGFGGALTEGLPPGSVICAERVVLYDEKTGTLGELLPLPRPPSRFQTPDIKPGTVVTADRPPDKKALARMLPASFHPAVVDMETYHPAQIFLEVKVPFLSLRSVCDELEFEPGLELELLVNCSGRIDLRRVCAYCLRDPRRLIRFFYLARRSALAAKSLCEVLARI